MHSLSADYDEIMHGINLPFGRWGISGNGLQTHGRAAFLHQGTHRGARNLFQLSLPLTRNGRNSKARNGCTNRPSSYAISNIHPKCEAVRNDVYGA